jgi:pimeloyl-ACP methyl ester carboxylesterase
LCIHGFVAAQHAGARNQMFQFRDQGWRSPMSNERKWTASNVPTEFIDMDHARLAYRCWGAGPNLILCTRYRGTMDSWDPAFVDALAARFRVITFDYRGTGRSTGEASYDPKSLAHDIIALADGLNVQSFVIGGWSLGGQAAQVVATVWADRVTQVVLLGTTPPGDVAFGPDPAFSACALKPHTTLDDDITLFFEPMSAASRRAARASRLRIDARRVDRSPDVPEDLYMRLLKESFCGLGFFDDGGYRDFLERTDTPILVVSGDHDIGFPVENWFNLAKKWRSLFLSVLPRSGHGVQHQYPELVAHIIGCFVESRHALDI